MRLPDSLTTFTASCFNRPTAPDHHAWIYRGDREAGCESSRVEDSRRDMTIRAIYKALEKESLLYARVFKTFKYI